MSRKLFYLLSLISLIVAPLVASPHAVADDMTYYVSTSDGDDDNDGLSEGNPFQSIAKVNTLDLQPGDQVLFKCGDVWRAEMLIITKSGAGGNPIVFGSYPADCENKPIISGSQPITGWSQHSGHVYAADLSVGGNAGKFAHGINQLFRDGERLRLGRWPNWSASDGGYAIIDGQPASDQITDNELPAQDWTGAVAHIKAMRWYIINREVTGASGTTLGLGADAGCWGGCEGWGYFLNSHRETLDQDGEWYYDESANEVYLYSSSGLPTGVEGSVILKGDGDSLGGVILGRHLQEHVVHVTVENFEIKNWFDNGITTPTNLETDDNAHLIIKDNHIRDVDDTGIRLATWVWNAADGIDGWRGGHDLEIARNVIEGANHFGIDSYAYDSSFHDNTLKDIGLIENVGRSGLGCGFTGSNCTENGDGIRIKLDQVERSARGNTLQYNRLEKTGYCGVDVFGPDNTLANNFIKDACYSKGDCGGVRTFGRNNLAETEVYSLTIRDNIIVNTIGNTDGANDTYKALFGMGLYIDNYSKDVRISGNTIISSTVDGILYQRSTGQITGNTLYQNNVGTMNRGQVGLYQSETLIAELGDNVLYALDEGARTLIASSRDNVTLSDDNYFFNPYREDHISAEGLKTLQEWQTYSGQDGNSKENWFSLAEGDEARSTIFYNDTQTPQLVNLGDARYFDLDQNLVSGTLTLQPFDSQVLIEIDHVQLDPPILFFDAQPLDTDSAPLTVTLTNAGLAPLEIVGVTASGDFSQTHDCPVSLAVEAACAIEVIFRPTEAGVRTGALTVTTAAGSYTADLVGGAWKVYLPLVVTAP
jgi:parallel beta-helix repeat protein